MPKTGETLGPGALLGQLGKRLRQAESAVREATTVAEGMREQLVAAEHEASAGALRDTERILQLEEKVALAERQLAAAREKFARHEEQLERQLAEIRGGQSSASEQYEQRIEVLEGELARARQERDNSTAARQEIQAATEERFDALRIAQQEAVEREAATSAAKEAAEAEVVSLRAQLDGFNRSAEIRSDETRAEIVRLSAELAEASQRAEDAEQRAMQGSHLREAEGNQLATAHRAVEESERRAQQAELARIAVEASQQQRIEQQGAVLRQQLAQAEEKLVVAVQAAEDLSGVGRKLEQATQRTLRQEEESAQLRDKLREIETLLEESRARESAHADDLLRVNQELESEAKQRRELSERLAQAEHSARQLEEQLLVAAESQQRAGALARLGQEE